MKTEVIPDDIKQKLLETVGPNPTIFDLGEHCRGRVKDVVPALEANELKDIALGKVGRLTSSDREAVVRDPRLPDDVAEKILKDPSRSVRLALVGREKLSERAVKALARDTDQSVAKAAVLRFESEEATVAGIMSDEFHVVDAIAMNEATPDWALMHIIANPLTHGNSVERAKVTLNAKDVDKKRLALHETYSRELLMAAWDKKENVEILLTNRSIPYTIPDTVARDFNAPVWLRALAIIHPNCTGGAIYDVAVSTDEPLLLEAIASTPKATEESLKKVLAHYNADNKIHCKLAANINTAPEDLEILATHHVDAVRGYAAKNQSTPDPYVRMLAIDRSTWVRRQVCWRKGVSRDILDALAADKDELVQSEARRNRGF